MAKLVDRVTRSYTGQLDHTHLDQPLGKKDHPDQRLLLAIRSLPCDRHQLSQVDGFAKIFSTRSAVYTNTDLLQLW
jgi:hypothetical protein